jgi:hypothetical protein
MAEGYSELANETVSAADGVDYAYRDTGGGREGGAPLVLLFLFQHHAEFAADVEDFLAAAS